MMEKKVYCYDTASGNGVLSTGIEQDAVNVIFRYDTASGNGVLSTFHVY